MSDQPFIKKAAQPKLNSVPLQELVLTLDEKAEELLLGGAKEKFIRYKPHASGSNMDSVKSISQSGIKYPVIVRFD